MRAVIKQREVTELDRFIPTRGKRKHSDAENSALISPGEVFLRRFSLFGCANSGAVGVLLVSFLVHRQRCFLTTSVLIIPKRARLGSRRRNTQPLN